MTTLSGTSNQVLRAYTVANLACQAFLANNGLETEFELFFPSVIINKDSDSLQIVWASFSEQKYIKKSLPSP
jgi:hypothetical protein